MRSLLLAFCFLFLVHISHSQNDAGAHYVDDFGILIKTMKELYPMLYKTVSKEQFEVLTKKAKEDLLKAHSTNAASYVIQRFLYQFADTHLSLASVYEDLGIRKILPFKVLILHDQLYIKNYPSKPTLNGTQIFSINNIPAGVLIDSLKVMEADDGNRRESFVMQPLFNSFFGAFICEADSFALKTTQGVIWVQAVKKGDSLYPDLIRNSWKEYMITDHDYVKKEVNADFAYFRFLGFEKKHGGYHIEKEFDKLINEINEKKTPNLIIDLRYNSGGDPLMGGRMAAQLIDRPFKVYERLILTPPGKPEYLSCMSDRLVMRLRTFGVKEVNDHYEKVHFDRGLKLVQPATNRYKGKIYVITGPMTVSTSSMFCSYLKGQSNVVFVGQETKGGINYLCAHESCEIRLPYSGVVATFGLQIVEVNKGSSDHEKSEGLIPDKCIEYSVEEFLAGKDKEMEWIKNDLLRK